MAFETPITVAEAVSRIRDRKYVLPAIQREFVWKPEQIISLFDSLLKGYPIGSFLFWTVRAEHAKQYTFYDFVQNFHERDARHNPKAGHLGQKDITAVLDGQQRLTALYIGICGTYAFRKARLWKNNPNAYPKRQLYLCLTRESDNPELQYLLEFREAKDDLLRDEDDSAWFRVGKILDFHEQFDVMHFLQDEQLANDKLPSRILSQLWQAVHSTGAVSAYLERSPELDRVLTIFVRVNSGGTKLSYSDLLLSMATAEWKSLDARETIYELVDEINRRGTGFGFSKDFVLKTCLMVADIETRFSTANFSAQNMKAIEKRWPDIKDAIVSTVELLVAFGLSEATITSANAVVPIVYYLAQRGNPKNFALAKAHEEDRNEVRRWLLTAMLKRTFTGQPDSILRVVRDVIKKKGKTSFPATAIIDALDRESRNMRVTDADLDRMLEETYDSGYAFSTLALLYPGLDFRNQFHKDHIHPRSTVINKRLVAAGMSDGKAREEAISRRDDIVNLQLLAGLQNQEKAAVPFATWFANEFGKKAKAAAEYRRTHYIPEDVPLDLGNLIEFTDARRALMREALREALDL